MRWARAEACPLSPSDQGAVGSGGPETPSACRPSLPLPGPEAWGLEQVGGLARKAVPLTILPLTSLPPCWVPVFGAPLCPFESSGSGPRRAVGLQAGPASRPRQGPWELRRSTARLVRTPGSKGGIWKGKPSSRKSSGHLAGFSGFPISPSHALPGCSRGRWEVAGTGRAPGEPPCLPRCLQAGGSLLTRVPCRWERSEWVHGLRDTLLSPGCTLRS